MVDKPPPYQEFGELLIEGIRGLARNRPMKAVHADLEERLGYSVSMIYHWRRGEYLPEPDIIAKLARIFAKESRVDQQWIINFLKKGEYDDPQHVAPLIKELFGEQIESGETEPILIEQVQPRPFLPESKPVSSKPAQTWQFDTGSVVAAVAISPDAEIIVASTLSKTIFCLDQTGQERWRAIVGNQAWRIAVSADAETIIVGTGSTRPWDLKGRGLFCFNKNGSLRWQVNLRASIWGLTISADGETIAAGTGGKQIILFDGQGNRLWQQAVPGWGPYAWVWTTALSFDGQTVVAGAANKQIRLLNRQGLSLAEYQARGEVMRVAISEDGETIAAGDVAGYVYLLNRHGSLVWEKHLADKVWAVALSRDGARLLVGADEKEAHLHTYGRAGNLLWRRYVGGVSNAALSMDGRRVAVGTQDGGIYIFDEEGEVLHHHRANKLVRDVAISAKGEQIIAGSEDGYVYDFDFRSTSPPL